MKSRVLMLALLLVVAGGCDRFASPEKRVARAERLMAEGDRRGAVVELLNALQDEPELPKARLLLGEAALWLGDPHGANRQLERISGGVDPTRLALLEVRVALALGKLDVAEKRLADDHVAWPRGQREYLRAQWHAQKRQPAEAQREFAAAFAADPSLVAARASELDMLAAQGNRPAALEGLAALTREHADSADAWLAYGAQFAAAGRIRESIDALQSARKLAPLQLDVQKHATLLSALVDLQLMEGRLDDARGSSDELNRVASDSLLARYVRARIAMAANDHVAAVNLLRQIVQQAPELQQARILLAMSLVAQGNLEQASATLNELIVMAPNNTVARQLFAQVRMRLDDPDGALRMLVPALQTPSDRSQVNALIDAARSSLGAEQSIALLKQMLEADPENRGLQAQLASAYLQAGAPAKAAELLGAGGAQADARRAALLVRAITETSGPQAARAQMDSLLASNPGDLMIANLAATYYARAGDFAAGRAAVQGALQRGADPGVLLLTLAQLEWSAGQRDAASAALARLLRAQPDHTAARMAAGEIALARRDYAKARELFTAVSAGSAGSVEARLRLAQLALLESRPAEADALIAEAVKSAPGSAAVRSAAGMLNLNSGRADAALEHFRAAVDIDSKDPLNWFNLAGARHALGQASAAREALEKALASRPHWVPASAALVSLDIEARDERAALARIAALKQALPKNPDVLELEGDAQATLLHHRDAVDAYRGAFELRPSASIATKDYRARVAGGLADKTGLLERWLAANPRDTGTRQLIADAEAREGNTAKAAEHYRAILEQRPDDVLSLNNLAWIYQQNGDARGMELARRAARLAPQSPSVNDTLGWLLLQSGQVADAQGYLAKAAQLAPNDPAIAFHHAAALEKTGKASEARQKLEILLRTHPLFPDRPAAEALLKKLPATAPETS